jgi:predicted TPR repeat methyltransferase
MRGKAHKDTIRSLLAKQAQKFGNPQLTLSNQQYIGCILDATPLSREQIVVDFACGTGIMARAIAPFVKRVIGVDLSSAMLAEAQLLAD